MEPHQNLPAILENSKSASRPLQLSMLTKLRLAYACSAIEDLYPELRHPVGDLAYLTYLAHWDFATTLTDNARRYLFCQQIAFTRLNELHLLSYLQHPHFDGPVDELCRLYCQWAHKQYTKALSYFGRAVTIRYNLLALDLILSSTLKKRLEHLQELRLLAMEVKKYGDSYIGYSQHMQQTWQTLKNDERLHQLDINILNAVTFMGSSAQDLSQIRISVQERSQAFAERSRVFIGSEGQTPDYRNISWRSGLLNILLESECPTVQMPHIGSVGPDDMLWCAEVQKYQWPFHQTLQVAELPDHLDAITLWHLPGVLKDDLIAAAFDKLKPGGLLITAVRRSLVKPESVRDELEKITGSTCYLIDRESFSDVLVSYVIKGHHFIPSLQILIVVPPYSVWTFGGLEWQLFKSRAFFKQRGIRSDISLACRLDLDGYDALYVLGYAYEDYKINWLAQSSLSKVYMPIPVIFGVEHVISSKFWEQLKQLRQIQPDDSLPMVLANWDFSSLRQHIQLERANVDTEAVLAQRMAQVCTYFIPQSQTELQMLFPHRDPMKIPHQLIVNGCESEIIQAASPDLFLHTHKTLPDFVLCTGRIEANKNQLLLCLALRETELPLVLIGTIDDPLYFQMCLEVSNGNVQHFQHFSDEMLASALKAAKVFVLPSCSEVFPLATAEAALAGCPVVSTRYSGQSDLFGDAFVYIDPFKVDDMKQTLLSVYHADNTARIAKAQAIAERYIPTWPQMADQIADVLYMQARYRQQPGLFLHDNRWYQLMQDCAAPTEHDLPLAYECHDAQLSRWVRLGNELNPQDKFALWLVHTDYTAYQLQQQGAVNIVKRALTFPESTGILLSPQWPTQVTLLCLYDTTNLFGWQEAINAFIQLGFEPKEAGLLIYVPAHIPQEQAESNILSFLSDLGTQVTDAENIILLTGIQTPELESALFNQVDAIIFPLKRLWGHETFWLRLMALKTPVITHEFDCDGFETLDVWLSSFEEVCNFSFDALIPVNETRLRQGIQHIMTNTTHG